MTTKKLNKKVEEMTALRQAGAIAILKDGKYVGKILIAYPKDGVLGNVWVNVWDWTLINGCVPDVQTGKSNAFGMDRLGDALHGLKFGGFTIGQDYKSQFEAEGYKLCHLI